MPRRGPIPSGKTTRERILDVASRLFVERGYAATSVRDIAAELGISNPSLYHHFASKERLLEELLAEPRERIAAALRAAPPERAADRASWIVGGLVDALEAHSGVVVAALQDAGTSIEFERRAAVPQESDVRALLGELVADDHPELRITMAIAAVKGAALHLTRRSRDGDEFVERLRAERAAIVAITLNCLTGELPGGAG